MAITNSFRLRSDNPYAPLGKALEQAHYVTRDQFRQASRQAEEEKRPLTEILLEDQTLPQEAILQTMAEHFGLESVRLRERIISPYVINLIPKELAEAHSVVIFKKIQDVIHVATTDPFNQQTVDFIRRHTQLEPQVFLTTPEDLRFAYRKYKSDLTEEFSKIIEDSLRDAEGSVESAENLAQHLPIIAMVNSVIERAISQRASDIHFEPTDQILTIRFRVDGLLRKIVELPKALQAPLVTRLKLLANLKIDEHRLPQDGRFTFDYGERPVAIRTSVVPTLHGSKVVLRLLDTKSQLFNLRGLGLNTIHLATLRAEMNKPHGMIIVTGPTGSGKTTTLYTLLRRINTDEVNICTIEDPIEYGLDGINQTQINPTAGLTFATGLRSLLRQDPNVIMVGEIRDMDTADIAVNAAMTGHLVLTTLHTNTAAQTIQRLVEMGVQPFLAASVLNVVIAQRLVRKVCQHCGKEALLTAKQVEQYDKVFHFAHSLPKLKEADLIDEAPTPAAIRVTKGRGCDKCQGTGYQGRVGIYELLPMNEKFHAAILRDPSPEAIEREAEQQGLLSMMEDGLLKILQGQTSFEEVLRVTK